MSTELFGDGGSTLVANSFPLHLRVDSARSHLYLCMYITSYPQADAAAAAAAVHTVDCGKAQEGRCRCRGRAAQEGAAQLALPGPTWNGLPTRAARGEPAAPEREEGAEHALMSDDCCAVSLDRAGPTPTRASSLPPAPNERFSSRSFIVLQCTSIFHLF
jgi:hypothetical protein